MEDEQFSSGCAGAGTIHHLPRRRPRPALNHDRAPAHSSARIRCWRRRGKIGGSARIPGAGHLEAACPTLRGQWSNANRRTGAVETDFAKRKTRDKTSKTS
jgi:hypothetical protein